MKRRRFLQGGGALAGGWMLPGLAGARDDWSGGEIRHLIPLTGRDSLLLKVSFAEPQRSPALRIGRRAVAGEPTDTLGRFWRFHADGLEGGQDYELVLERRGRRYADSWPLRTTPAGEAERARLLVFSCAGGPDDARTDDGRWRYLPVGVRQRLLARALAFEPDLAVGVGDQVYWDQFIAPRWRGDAAARVARERIWGKYGRYDEDLPVLGSSNEPTLTGCLDEQIASLYGARFRSVPLILTQDDHDYFENDEGLDEIVTFPPRHFTAQLARASQRLYYPEYLPDAGRPVSLPGSNRAGFSESYGSWRFGSLLELLLYDCRRRITLAGPTAVFVEPQAERWLLRRTADQGGARHLMHIPSTPFGWTAGKWGEWYPDYLQPDGRLGVQNPKPYWQAGWFAQHQRLLSGIAGQGERIPIVVSGDLHAIGSGLIARSGGLDFGDPVHAILAGPVSTGTGWPSAVRGIPAGVPRSLHVTERTAPMERNGFSLFDVDADGIDVRQFAWLPAQGLDAIDSMQPFSAFRISRREAGM